MTFEDMDLDSDLEPTEEPPPPEESGNRTFLIAAGILGGITVLALICMVLYALVLLPRQRIAQQGQIATVNAQNTQVALAITQTSSALRKPTNTPVSSNAGGAAWLGIIGQTLNSAIAELMNLLQDQKGVLVGGLEPGSPAEESGLKPSGQNVAIGGDVITAVDGQPVSTLQDIESILSQHKQGDSVNVTFLRDGQEQTVPITLGTQQAAGGTPWLGVTGRTLDPATAGAMNLAQDQKGVLVGGLVAGSPAAQAGLQPNDQEASVNGKNVPVGGDVVTAVDGQPVSTLQDIESIINQHKPGDSVEVTFLRDGQEQTVPITLGTQQAAGGTPWLGVTGRTLDPATAGAMNLAQDQKGVLVGGLVAGSPAAQAGLQPNDQEASVNGKNVPIGGDVVTAVDGQPVSTPQDIESIINQHKPGDSVEVTFLRDGQEQTVPITLGTQQAAGGTPWLGVTGRTLDPATAGAMNLAQDQKGVLVGGLVAGSPAAQAGLQPNDQEASVNGKNVPVGGDVITAVDGQPVSTPQDIESIINQHKPGDSVEVTFLRDGQEQTVPITLGTQQAAGGTPWLGVTGRTLDPATAGAMNLAQDQKGVLVGGLVAGSPAAQAGLQPNDQEASVNGKNVPVGGDVVTAVDGNPVSTPQDIESIINQHKPGDSVEVTFLRNGQEQTVPITLGTQQAAGGTPSLGVTGQPLSSAIANLMGLSPDQKGVLVGGLEPGSPAEQAGLKPNGQNVSIGGDVVTALDGQPVNSPQDIETIISQHKPGDTVEVTLLRNGQEQTVPITLGSQQVAGRPAWLGILGQALSSAIANLMGLSPDQKGVLVGGLEPGSPAETAGMFPNDQVATINGQDVALGGDIVTSINGTPVTIPQDIQTILNQLKPGDTVNVQFMRDGKLQTIPIVLAPRPAGAIPTPTPVVAVALAPTASTIDPRTATVAALLTQAAVNTRTVVPTATALPQTGFADEVGLPALLGLAILLIAVIFIARRLRTAS